MMFVLDKSIFKFLIALVILVILTGSVCIYSNANAGAIVVEKKISSEAEEGLIDDYYLTEEKPVKTKKTRQKHKKNKSFDTLELSDSYFLQQDKQPTLKDLLFKVSSIFLFLLGILIIVKSTSNSKSGNFSGFLGKLKLMMKSNLLAPSELDSLKLIQSLTLTPGQYIYLVEINNKKILLGSTAQGGINYLTDLSQEVLKELDFKQIEFLQEQSKKQSDNDISNIFVKDDKLPEVNEKHEKILNKASFDLINSTRENNVQKSEPPKIIRESQSFKRRTRFSQTLLTSHK